MAIGATSDDGWVPDDRGAQRADDLQPRGRGQRDAYRAAAHHSGRVRLLRRVIPIGSATAIVVLVVVSFFNPFGSIKGVTMGPISMTGTKVTMEAPKLTGFRKDNKPYEVTAIAAAQDVRKPNVVELQQLKARLGMENASFAHLEADSGIYDMKGEQLRLSGQIKVNTDSGYHAILKSAQVDLKGGGVVTNEPVRITLNDGSTVDANSMDLRDNGKRIAFDGQVKTVLYMHDDPKPKADQHAVGDAAASKPAPAPQ
jgi:lipopolysaccharide export system protein LptC